MNIGKLFAGIDPDDGIHKVVLNDEQGEELLNTTSGMVAFLGSAYKYGSLLGRGGSDTRLRIDIRDILEKFGVITDIQGRDLSEYLYIVPYIRFVERTEQEGDNIEDFVTYRGLEFNKQNTAINNTRYTRNRAKLQYAKTYVDFLNGLDNWICIEEPLMVFPGLADSTMDLGHAVEGTTVLFNRTSAGHGSDIECSSANHFSHELTFSPPYKIANAHAQSAAGHYKVVAGNDVSMSGVGLNFVKGERTRMNEFTIKLIQSYDWNTSEEAIAGDRYLPATNLVGRLYDGVYTGIDSFTNTLRPVTCCGRVTDFGMSIENSTYPIKLEQYTGRMVSRGSHKGEGFQHGWFSYRNQGVNCGLFVTLSIDVRLDIFIRNRIYD